MSITLESILYYYDELLTKYGNYVSLSWSLSSYPVEQMSVLHDLHALYSRCITQDIPGIVWQSSGAPFTNMV